MVWPFLIVGVIFKNCWARRAWELWLCLKVSLPGDQQITKPIYGFFFCKVVLTAPSLKNYFAGFCFKPTLWLPNRCEKAPRTAPPKQKHISRTNTPFLNPHHVVCHFLLRLGRGRPLPRHFCLGRGLPRWGEEINHIEGRRNKHCFVRMIFGSCF